MAHIPIANCVRVCVRMLQNGQESCNVYHVDVGVNPNFSILQAVAVVFQAWVENSLRTAMHPSTSVTAIEVTDAFEEDGEGIVYTAGLPLAGTQAGNPMPNNVSVAIKLLSGFTGRSRRGRKFFAGLSDSVVTADGQQVTSTFANALEVIFTNLLDEIATAGFTWVIASLFTNGAPRAAGVVTPIVSVLADTFLDSMRKRLSTQG